MAQAANSALYSARLRFVEGLAGRAQELSSTAERLARDPNDLEAAAILRRRLHALLASSQVFEERALSLAVQDLIARLDLAQRAERKFTTEEIDAVSVVVASLPTYVRPSLPVPPAHSDVHELLSDADLHTIRPPLAAASVPIVIDQPVVDLAPVPKLRGVEVENDEQIASALDDIDTIDPFADFTPVPDVERSQPSAAAAEARSESEERTETMLRPPLRGDIASSMPPSVEPDLSLTPLPPRQPQPSTAPKSWSRSGVFEAAPASAVTPSAAASPPRAEALSSVFGRTEATPKAEVTPAPAARAEPTAATLASPAAATSAQQTTSAGIGSPMTAITATSGYGYAAVTAAIAPEPETLEAEGGGFVDTALDEPTDPQLDPPVFLKQTVSGLLPAPRAPVVLVVAEAGRTAKTHESLESGPLELVRAQSADEAIRLLRETTPVLVLVSAELACSPEADLVRRLKSDPLTPVSNVHVLFGEDATYDDAFLEQVGADGIAREPLTAESLQALLEQPSEMSSESAEADAVRGVREGTIDDIATQIAEEIRRGIAESMRVGKNERVRVGDGSELMAAAWSAIGRVRSHLAEQNRGRVRVREDDRRLSSISSSLLPAVTAAEIDTGSVPAVHPSQLLAGCRVLIADDDPAVLWFFAGLLREASANVFSAHNGREALELARRKQPHVVVSDILMPKLDGFGLCRELKRDVLLAHVPVILLSWKDDLLQRMRELDSGAAGYLRKEAGSQQILAQLADVLKPRTRLIAKLRGQAEVDGTIEGIGVSPLLELVAAERPDSRIVVRDARSVFEIDIRAGRKLAVTRTADDGTFTRGEKALMQLLGLGSGTFEVSYSGTPLRAALNETLDRALSIAGRRLAALLDAVSDARLLRVSLVGFDDEVLTSLSGVGNARLPEVVALFRTGNTTAEAVLRDGRFTPGELEDALRDLGRNGAISGVWSADGEDLVAGAQRDRETPQLALLSSAPPRGASRWSFPPEPREVGARDTPMVPIDPIVFEAGARSTFPAPIVPPEASMPSRQSSPPTAAAVTLGRAQADTEPGPPPPEATASMNPRTIRGLGPDGRATTEEVAPDAVTSDELEQLDLPLPGTLARLRDRAEGFRLLATLVVLAAIGYFGWLQLKPSPAPVQKSAPHVLQPAPIAPPATPTPALPNTQFGKVLPFVDPAQGVAVQPGEGLLVVEYKGEEPLPTVRVGDRELGKPPIAISLPPGRHELVLRSGKSTSFRYLIVRAGETRVVSLPLADL